MKIIALMTSTLATAARLTHTDCADKVEIGGIELAYDISQMAYTNGEIKLAQNPADSTWMMVNPENAPIVSFDKANCVEDNKKWYTLDMASFEYQPASVQAKKL